MLLDTPGKQGFIDKFYAVVVVITEHREQKRSLNVSNRGLYPAIRCIKEGAFLYPPRIDVSPGQSFAELATRRPSAV